MKIVELINEKDEIINLEIPNKTIIKWIRIDDHLILVKNIDLNQHYLCSVNQWLYSSTDSPLSDAVIINDYIELM